MSSTLAMPFGSRLGCDSLDAECSHTTPVVLAHGLFGSRTNFASLRRTLEARGIARFTHFTYGPRIDYQVLAERLEQQIEDVCARTGSAHVDLVGHSLGGLVARHMIEHGNGRRIRRLVSLGSPWWGYRFPQRELVLFGQDDWLIPSPNPRRTRGGQVVVVPGCGHLGMLYHPEALERVAAFLSSPPGTIRLIAPCSAREAA
jgi:pimeloyl-ACP methyl ester carboxylesterase